jgi:hypothetical protein
MRRRVQEDVLMRPTYLGLGLLLLACSTSIDPSLENRACTASGECLAGYVCSPERVCIKATESTKEPQTAVDAGLEVDATAPDASGVNTGSAPLVCDQGVMCGGSCVDLQQNPEHCGACDRPCPSVDHGQAACSSGTCALACDDGYTRCGDRCYRLSSDTSHCGSCTFSCPSEINSDVACVEGKCQTSCNPGARECGGECVRVETDARHCGECGKACAADEQCAAGTCVKECPAGTTACQRSCVDTKSDVQHCGGCGQACAAPNGASALCQDGACAFGCTAGLMACGNTCVDTQTDIANCGACGQACKATSAFNHAVCEAGSCSIRCNTGFIACQNQCVSLAVIANSRALAACAVLGGLQDLSMCANMGQSSTYCGAECVDTSRDERHCGACERACGAGQSCKNGTCKMP